MMTAEQLKDSILLLAMQGKLETNSSTDVPIASVLRKIYAGKGRINPIDPEQIPYDIPENWKWARLEDITDNCDNPFADGPFGSNLKREHYTEKHEVRIIQLSNIGENGWRDTNEKYTTYEHLKTIERSKVNAGDIVIAKMMPAGRAIEVPMNDYAYVLSSDAVKFVAHPLLNKRFLLMAINSPVFREQVYSEVHGVTRVRTSLKKLKSYIVPLPPLAEQKRIVAKIEELMPFVEQYAVANTKLNTLNASFSEMMKKSILQEAVQGKLVPQDPNDEPASLLLKKIAEEKKRLIKEGKIKKQKPLPEITEDEIPFDIPDSWEWVRFENIVDMLSGFAFKSSEFVQDGKYRLLRGINLGVSEVRWDDTVYVNGIPDKLSIYRLEKGDVLLGLDRPWISNGIRVDIFDGLENTYLVQRVLRIREIGALTSEYVALILRSSLLSAAVQGQTTGISVPHISPKQVGSIVVPVPPVEEQKRIVEKVKLLCKEIDSLRK